MRSCLDLLFRIALLKVKGYPWDKLRELYAGVVRAVEMREIRWGDDFRYIEEQIIDPADRVIKQRWNN